MAENLVGLDVKTIEIGSENQWNEMVLSRCICSIGSFGRLTCSCSGPTHRQTEIAFGEMRDLSFHLEVISHTHNTFYPCLVLDFCRNA